MKRPNSLAPPLSLGLAHRVVLLACFAAVAATVAQWLVTPVLLRRDFDRARLVYAQSAAQQMAATAGTPLAANDLPRIEELISAVTSSLPGGQAVVLDREGNVLRESEGGAAIRDIVGPIRQESLLVRKNGAHHVGIAPIFQDGVWVGSFAVGFSPKYFSATYGKVLAQSALILVLALSVIAPFFMPLARRVLKPVTDLEQSLRRRAPGDQTALAEVTSDPLLQPLLAAIDDAHRAADEAQRDAQSARIADPTTQLPNRGRFMARLEALSRESPTSICLAICDLKGFRKINMTHGLSVGDHVLRIVADRLRTACESVSREQLDIGRLGGDQFAIMSAKGWRPLETALDFADRAIAEPIHLGAEPIRIALQFGMASADAPGVTSADLLKRAEIALKEAKRTGGGTRVRFDERLQRRAAEQSALEAGIREGLERSEFIAVFQPKLRLDTGTLMGAEALARWRRPDGSIVSPGMFIPIAEELGLIHKLGASVMRDACHAAAQWCRDGRQVSVAVNVSPHQLDDPDFVSIVNAALEDSGLDPRFLELEITESAAVLDPDRVGRIMWPLRSRGVRLAIDDFGTGHSNFTAVTRLPFDVVKIDQQFVRALSTDSTAPAIVEMILAMSEALGQETVAEGVETREQADFLSRRGCAYAQGYLFSPPLPSDEFETFLRAWRPRPWSRLVA